MSTATTTTTPRLSTGEAAKAIGVHPRALADLLYRNRTLYDCFELVAGRRVIPADQLDAIRIEARRCGLLPRREVARVG